MQSDYTQIVKINCATRKAQFGATGGTSDMCSSHVNSVTNFHTGGSVDSVQMLELGLNQSTLFQMFILAAQLTST